MSLATGSKLGPYEIVSRIGAGGMGEVFKARDTRLDRTVAIKILPQEFADSPQFRARFEREAKAISQLNHPNICTLHDVGHESDTSFLVMELVEGESLSDRLSRGPLPVADVLRYGGEIAAALDRAHRAGIVHRDVKPGNIMITRSGVKLLDFGLAKTASIGVAHDAETQHKPLTAEGSIIGTFQYMAPEQLEGIEADPRTDIFALGVVLYEMATGKHAFEGKTRTSLIASIVASEPQPVSDVQPSAPPALERVIELCIRKDREERWQSAHDVRLELEGIRNVSSPPAGAASRRRWMPAAFLGLLALGTLAFLAGRTTSRAPQETAARLNLAAPDGGEIKELALSPDGRTVAMAATGPGGRWQLWIRNLATGSTLPVEGAADASQLFWSPDGKFVGFMRPGSLQRVAVSGGSVESICAVTNPSGATWNAEGTIVFVSGDNLYRVNASGGEPQRLPPHGKRWFSWPYFLPDGKHFLVLSGDVVAAAPPRIAVASLDPHEPPRDVVQARSNASYAAPGFLLYVKGRTLLAQRFDNKAFKVSGEPMAIGHQVDDNDFLQYVFTVSNEGTLAYRSRDVRSRLHLRDRTGKDLAQFGEPADWAGFVISPDGTKALAERVDEERRNGSLWLIDLLSGNVNRFSSDPGWHGIGAWAPDSTRFAYTVRHQGTARVFEGKTNSTLTRKISDLECFTQSWVGDWIGCEVFRDETTADVELLSASTGKRFPIAATKAWENTAAISPDGRWVAYSSGSDGVGGVFVQPIPTTGERWQVASGLWGPLWSPDGRKLFCGAGDALFEMEISSKDGKLTAGVPQRVFENAGRKHFKNRMSYGVIGSGEKFLVNELESNAAPTHVILNWTVLTRGPGTKDEH